MRYLPPYSPFLKPIENSFTALKAAIKRNLANDAGNSQAEAARREGISKVAYRERQLARAIKNSVPLVTLEHIQQMHAHNYTFFRLLMNNQQLLSQLRT